MNMLKNNSVKISIVVVVISIVVFGLILYKSDGPYTLTQNILDSYLEKYKVEYELKMKEKDKEIEQKDNQLKLLNNRLQQVQLEYNKTKGELDILKKKSNINEPKDNKEVKDRLRILGYSPR